MQRGKLILIEGTDCSGKETQSKLLIDYLKSNGIDVVRMAFPAYDSPTGKIVGGPYLGKSYICGRTGLVSLVVSICFLLSLPFAGFVSGIPSAATAPALLIVGVMMMGTLDDIDWDDLGEAIPATFASVPMALTYGITNGIMLGFWSYTFVKLCQGKIKDVHPIILVSDLLFILNYLL